MSKGGHWVPDSTSIENTASLSLARMPAWLERDKGARSAQGVGQSHRAHHIPTQRRSPRQVSFLVQKAPAWQLCSNRAVKRQLASTHVGDEALEYIR